MRLRALEHILREEEDSSYLDSNDIEFPPALNKHKAVVNEKNALGWVQPVENRTTLPSPRSLQGGQHGRQQRQLHQQILDNTKAPPSSRPENLYRPSHRPPATRAAICPTRIAASTLMVMMTQSCSYCPTRVVRASCALFARLALTKVARCQKMLPFSWVRRCEAMACSRGWMVCGLSECARTCRFLVDLTFMAGMRPASGSECTIS